MIQNAPASVLPKKNGVALRDSSKLQLIHRNSSQASGLNLQLSTERHKRVPNTAAQVTPALSQRGGKPSTSHTDVAQKEQSRSSISTSIRRQQQNRTLNNANQAQAQLAAPLSSLRDFHMHQKIGVGAYSEVYQVTRKSDSIEYALKQVKIQRLTEKEKQNALNEVRILASINNQNVIAYKEAFFDEDSSTLCIVMEYAKGGDLYTKIMEHQKSATEFSERDIWDVLVQMTAGLKALHARNILHRDLKSANIFQNLDGTIKLGDLNVSKIAQDGMLYTQTGTPYYASPEVWQEKPYDSKSDIWSLGCIAYEMCALNPPFRAKSMKGLYNSVLSGMYPKLPQHYSEELSQMIKLLLQVNPAKRPNCEQLLQHDSILRYLHSAQNSGFGAAAALISDQDKTTIQEALLQTIHCPRNLSQLSQILPRSKYQSGVERRESQELELITQTQPAPQTAATVERKSKKRRQNATENQTASDRNNIIEMAQQIVLPPIRETDTSSSNLNAPSILQQQQQRQLELLNLRRQKQSTNRNRGGQGSQPEGMQRPPQTSAERRKSKPTQRTLHNKPQSSHNEMQDEPSRPRSMDSERQQPQLGKKKKIKTQLQIRQQIGRVAQKDLKINAQRQHPLQPSTQSSALSSYPVEIANTLAAQNLQCLENYQSSLIDLPPSIENIYATNDLISVSSRFNHYNLPSQQNMPHRGEAKINSSRHQEDQAASHAQGVAHELNQQVKYLPQVHTSMQRHGSQSRGLDQLNNHQRNTIMNHDVYASQQNLLPTSGSLASAQRYQSVGIINLPRESVCNISESESSVLIQHQGAVPPTQIKSGGGNTCLPGLKQNLQSIKSAQQLQKLTSSEPGSSAVQRRVKQVLNESSQQQLLSGEPGFCPSQHPLPERQSTAVSQPQQPSLQQTSQAQLPPRQPSTTRNGGTTRNQHQKLKTGSNITMSQRSLAIKQHVLGGSKHQQKLAEYGDQEIAAAGSISQIQRSPGGIEKLTPGQKRKTKVSPRAMLQRRQSLQQSTSQKKLLNRNNDDINASQTLIRGKDSGSTRPMQASVDINSNRRNGRSDLASSMPTSKLAAKQKKELTQSVVQASKDKSKIIVELMPFHGNSGRASTKGQTGRNTDAGDFSQNIERMVTQDESQRLLRGKNTIQDASYSSQTTINGKTLDLPVSRSLRSKQGASQAGQMLTNAQGDFKQEPIDGDHTQYRQNHDKQSSLKQMRLQQRMKNKKTSSGGGKTQGQVSSNLSRKSINALNNQTVDNELKRRAQQIEAAIKDATADSVVQDENMLSNGCNHASLRQEVNSFELQKQNHQMNTGTQLEQKKSVQNLTLVQSKSITSSKQKLPSLKTNFEGDQNVSSNQGRLNAVRQGVRVDSQQFERSHQAFKEGCSTPSMSNLEKNKQYLEQLRQLASVRHQKKQSGTQGQQSSVKTKKNGGNKAAAALLTAPQDSSSPTSLKLAGQISQFNAQSSVPKLPSCQDARVVASSNNEAGM